MDETNYFLNNAYKIFPKNLDFYDEDYKVNPQYLESTEYIYFKRISQNNFNLKEEFVEKLILNLQMSSDNQIIEFRNITNFHMGDRAINIQNSSFFDPEKMKYYPICFVFSGIIPFYSYYVSEIDISFKNTDDQNRYFWKKNNGMISNYSFEINQFIENVEVKIKNKTKFKPFPKDILYKKIPDISSESKKKGELSFFNAFFLDDFYCFP